MAVDKNVPLRDLLAKEDTPEQQDDFEVWVSRARARLVRGAAALLADHAEAENVVQATLEAIWKLHRDGVPLDLNRYASRAVRMNALRLRLRRREFIPVDSEALEDAELGASGGFDPRAELMGWELERAILGLPPAQQAALRLRFYAGLSFQEMGQALSVSMNTAASRCRYALRALRSAFKSRSPERGEDR